MVKYITAPLAPMRSAPAYEGPLISELLHGEEVHFKESHGDWSLVENVYDRHTGYVLADSFSEAEPPTHVVTALGSFLYKEAFLKTPVLGQLSFMSKVTVLDVDGHYAQTPHGYLHISAIRPIGEFHADPVDTARLFLNLPYKWGGRSYAGLDCSSLTQLVFEAYGVRLPKNAGPQSRVLQAETTFADLARNDLVYMKGHVMLATGNDTIIQADGPESDISGMRVREMKLDEALAERGVARENVTLKKCPLPDSQTHLKRVLKQNLGGKPVNNGAFAALSGPDIMS